MPGDRAEMGGDERVERIGAPAMQCLAEGRKVLIVRQEPRPLEQAEKWQGKSARRREQISGERHEQDDRVERKMREARREMHHASERPRIGRCGHDESIEHARRDDDERRHPERFMDLEQSAPDGRAGHKE